jgi:hypothetical protein
MSEGRRAKRSVERRQLCGHRVKLVLDVEGRHEVLCSAVEDELRTTKSPRYAEMQRDGGLVSGDEELIVLIHKQRLAACRAWVVWCLSLGGQMPPVQA